MNLNKWFEKGISPEKYIESLEKHKDNFLHIYHHFRLPNDEDFFMNVKNKNLRVIVLAEPWCGHCMLNIPVLLRLSEQTNMSVRVVPRDKNLELMDRYLTNDKRIIPIIIFLDKAGNEVAKWGPVAETTKQFVEKYKVELPPKDSPDYEEKFKWMVKGVSQLFRETSEIWNGCYESMKQTLESSI